MLRTRWISRLVLVIAALILACCVIFALIRLRRAPGSGLALGAPRTLAVAADRPQQLAEVRGQPGDGARSARAVITSLCTPNGLRSTSAQE